MANVFVTLAVPASDGAGAWSDVSAQGPEKTIVVDGAPFGGDLILEGSNDGQVSAGPVAVGPFGDGTPGPTPPADGGPGFAPKTFTVAYNFLRIRRRNSGGVGTPTVTIGGPAAIASVFGAMNVPAGDGVGTPIVLSGGGDINTFQVVGPFTDQILIETSTDGVTFSPTLIFDNGAGAVGQTVVGVLAAARVRRRVRGTLAGVSPLISVGSQATSGAAGGAFPGFGAAPPAVAAASAAGVAATASRSDHTHAGTSSVNGATGAATFASAGGSLAITGAAPALNFEVVFGGAPPAIAAAGAAGAASTASRSDHTHAGVSTFQGSTGAASITSTGATVTITNVGGVVNLEVAGGGGFPGFGGAPPVTSPTASAAGGAGTASRSDHTHVNNFNTGVAGGQTGIGGTLTTQNLTLRPNLADAITGQVIVQGLGLQVTQGTAANPGVAFTGSNGGIFSPNGSVQISVGAAAALYVDNTTLLTQSNADGSGLFLGASARAAVTFDAALGAGTPGINVFTGFPSLSRLNLTGVGNVRVLNSPFVSFSSGAALGQTAGTVMRYGIVPPSQAAAANSRLDAYIWDAVTATFTGGTNITTALGVNLITINAPVFTNATPMSITNAATLAITGPPVSGGSLVLGALAVSLWVQTGSSRFDGTVLTSQINPIAGTLTLQDSGATSIWTLSNTSALLLAPTIRIGGTAGSTAGDTFLTPATGGAGAAVTIFGTVSQFLKIAIPINLSTANVTPNNITAATIGSTGPTGMSSLPVEYAVLSTPGGNRAFPLFSMP